MQRVAAGKPTGGSGFNKNANKNANPGSGPRKNYEKPRTQAKPPQPKKDLAQKSRPKQVDATRTETLRAVKPDVSGGSTTYSILGSSPAPQTIVHVELESTDFASLFGASPSLSASPSTASLKTTPTDAASRRVQLILEYQGGDYSKLVPNSLVTSQGSPLVYAESTMARRRELGPNRRNDALGIVRGMIDKSQGSQPTA
ncbi:hypothetical protein BDM02DRAFT_2676955 [Thelephora ganbajun]|uniref:Uncharacterized protein n=1 Tax=Thelephora ganbajun TaxID=370292 RepID=A0ACB6ZD33_THEGA|nr:hypothetical protein BDM02DRAFT_2676955 [Thelephora ganbajun]